jgi:hypothetical protein
MAEEELDMDFEPSGLDSSGFDPSGFDPFGEEFSDSDVVGRKDQEIIDEQKRGPRVIKKEEAEERESKAFELGGFSQNDINQLVSYDNERRKQISFKNELSDEIDLDVEKPDNVNKFRDFIVAPHISGVNKRIKGDARIYPSNLVHKTGHKTEIADHPFKERDHKEKAAVIINRDETGDVDNIEIVCSCGERVLLKFNVTEANDIELTRSEYKKIDEPDPFSIKDIRGGEVSDYSETFEALIEEEKEIALGKKLTKDERFDKKKEKVYKELSGKTGDEQSKEISGEDWDKLEDGDMELGDIDLSDI